MYQKPLTSCLGAALLALAAAAHSQPVGEQAGSGAPQFYKSIGADGSVVYSSSPPRDVAPEQVETVRVDRAPSESDRAAAERRTQAMQQGPAPRAGSPAATGAEPEPKPRAAAAGADAQREDPAVARARSTSRERRATGAASNAGGRAGGQRASGRGTP